MSQLRKVIGWGVGAGIASLVVGPVFAQAPNTNPTNRIIYPSEGQTQEQMALDQLECYNWALESTGVDPAAAYQQYVQVAQGAQANVDATQGSAVRGAARGAAAGAAIGAISGDAGKGAAIGATAGGMGGAFRRRDQAAAEQNNVDQAAAQYEQAMTTWDRAFVACMGARDYSIN